MHSWHAMEKEKKKHVPAGTQSNHEIVYWNIALVSIAHVPSLYEIGQIMN